MLYASETLNKLNYIFMKHATRDCMCHHARARCIECDNLSVCLFVCLLCVYTLKKLFAAKTSRLLRVKVPSFVLEHIFTLKL